MTAVVCGKTREFIDWALTHPDEAGNCKSVNRACARSENAIAITTREAMRGRVFDQVIYIGTYHKLPDILEIEYYAKLVIRP
jgi:hypothetical protein